MRGGKGSEYKTAPAAAGEHGERHIKWGCGAQVCSIAVHRGPDRQEDAQVEWRAVVTPNAAEDRKGVVETMPRPNLFRVR